jgi:hypothetical protein
MEAVAELHKSAEERTLEDDKESFMVDAAVVVCEKRMRATRKSKIARARDGVCCCQLGAVGVLYSITAALGLDA